jgi:hypothetical protein
MISLIKINRKPNGEILGLPIFLGKDVIEKFADSKTTHLEVTKTATVNGVLLEFEPIKAVNQK